MVPVVDVTYSVIREARLPNIAPPLQRAFRLKREATFDELDGTLQWYQWAKQQMNVV